MRTDSERVDSADSVFSADQEYTVDEALTLIGMGKFQYKILVVTGMIWGADAIEIMILTFLLPILAEEWNLNAGEDGTIGAVVFAGMLIGAVFWPMVSDRYGRRWAVILSNLGQIVFGMLSATAWNMYSMMVWRFITGFCLGAASCSFTLYAEFAPKADRGKLLILQQSFWALGAFFNSLLAWLVLETLDWRWYLVISSLPLVLILYLAYQVPESVQFLVNIGKVEQAEQILQRAAKINKSHDVQNPDQLRLKRQQIVHQERGNPREIFASQYVHTSITCFIIMVCITFTYYGVSFLSERFFDGLATNQGEDDSQKYWQVAVTTSAEIPGVILGMFTLDTMGRKKSMIVYFAVTAVCLFCLISEDIQNMEWLAIGLVFISRGLASLTFFIIYVYFSEVYPTRVRNTALGFAAALSRISGMATTFVSASDDVSYSFYLLALSAAAGCVASMLLQRDTTGVNLSELVQELHPKEASKQHELRSKQALLSD